MVNRYLSPTRRHVLAGAGAAATATLLSSKASPVLAAAPLLGSLRPSIYRFKLGSFEVTNILDGAVRRKGPHPIFGQNQTAETVAAYAVDHHLPANHIENPYTVTLVNTGQELILFDTGNGPARRDEGTGKLRQLLAEAGYAPDQIDVVVVTHGHPDHIGGLMEGASPAFEKARYVFGEVEFDYWRKGENIPEQRAANRKLFMERAVPFGERARFVQPGDDLVSGIRAVEAFGHSPGMLAYHIESGNDRLLLWADVTNHYVVSLQKPEWHVAFDHDKDAGVATRQRILDMVATEKIPAIGYHMPFPAVGYVDRFADGYRWVPVSYQFER